MFDEGLISIDRAGKVVYRKDLDSRHAAFIDGITPVKQLPGGLMTERFLYYLDIRNQLGC